MLSALIVNAGELSINIDSSGPFSVTNNYDTQIIQNTEDNYLWREYLRNNVVKKYAKCAADNCSIFQGRDLMDIYKVALDTLSPTQARDYMSNVVAGFIIGSNQAKRAMVYETATLMLDFEQKMKVGSILGSMIVANYDYSRVDGGKGIVSQEEIFKALRSGQKAGICRDIATAQAKVLKRLGVEQTYVIAFQTADSGHATVVAQDNNDKSKIVHLNYGEVASGVNSGVSSLNQDGIQADGGVVFRVFDSEGTPISQVPSELGFVLNKVAGVDLSLSAPGISDEGIHLVSVDYTSSKGAIKFFSAMSATNQETVGLSSNFIIQDTKHVDMKFGGAIHMSKKDMPAKGTSNTKQGAFGALETKLSTSEIDLGPLKNIRGDIDGFLGIYIGAIDIVDGTRENPGVITDITNMITASLQTEASVLGFDYYGKVSIHGSVMKSDVRDEGSKSLNYLGTTVRNVIQRRINNKYNVQLENMVYIKKSGTTMSNSIIVVSEDGKDAYEVGFSNPIYGKPAFWNKGATKEFHVGAKKTTLKDKLELQVQYVNKIELDNEQFNLKAKYKFK